MTDQQLLLAISSIMDEKIKPLEHRMDGMEQKMDGMEQRMDGMEQRMDRMEQRMDGMEQRIGAVEQSNRRISLQLEHNVIPHLNELSECYTSTYKEYAKRLDKIDACQMDVDILKHVVAEHSQILQQFS